jgi:hypothetical protein
MTLFFNCHQSTGLYILIVWRHLIFEYQASLEAARRVEEVNQARSNYERQLAEYQQHLGEREFQNVSF